MVAMPGFLPSKRQVITKTQVLLNEVKIWLKFLTILSCNRFFLTLSLRKRAIAKSSTPSCQ